MHVSYLACVGRDAARETTYDFLEVTRAEESIVDLDGLGHEGRLARQRGGGTNKRPRR
jgi:hypothetical protein